MEISEFIDYYKEAFGSQAQLPLLFGYSDQPIADTGKIGGCFFKGLQQAREGDYTRAFPRCRKECLASSR